MKLLPVVNNESPSVCGQCGGRCCKRIPGIYHPTDFKSDLEIADGIARGVMEIDVRPSDGVRFVQPTDTGKTGDLFSPEWPCVNHSQAGCSLTFKKRPMECRTLVPMPEFVKGGRCVNTMDKNDIAEAWKPHQELLVEAEAMAERMRA